MKIIFNQKIKNSSNYRKMETFKLVIEDGVRLVKMDKAK